MFKLAAFAVMALIVSGCGKATQQSSTAPGNLPPVDTYQDGAVVKARALITVSTGAQAESLLFKMLLPQAFAASDVNVPVSTTVSPSTTFALSTALFSVPASPTPFAVDDFGFLQVSQLQDNNLDVCKANNGNNSNQHCGTAILRIYTTGTPGAGLWNTVDSYGAPISATQANPTSATSNPNPSQSVGLSATAAAVMQTITIPSSKHTVLMSDFANAKYDVSVDFTNAGAGAYATTLVVEYALSN